MCFRIIVKQQGAFLFRTSKLGSAKVAARVHAALVAGLPANTGVDDEYIVEILQVDGLPVGSIITYEALQTAAAQPGDNDDPA